MFLSEGEMETFRTVDMFYQQQWFGFLSVQVSISGADLLQVKKQEVCSVLG